LAWRDRFRASSEIHGATRRKHGATSARELRGLSYALTWRPLLWIGLAVIRFTESSLP
jgi:hypothetical protein